MAKRSRVAKRAAKKGARAVLRSFRTTSRLLEDEEMDDLLEMVINDGRAMLRDLRQLPTCSIKEWGFAQFGHDDPRQSELFRLLYSSSSSSSSSPVEAEVEVETKGGDNNSSSSSNNKIHLASLLNVEVEDEHPHWIVMLIDVANKRATLVDSLAATEGEGEEEKEEEKKEPVASDVDTTDQDLLQMFQHEEARKATKTLTESEQHLLMMQVYFCNYLGEQQAAEWKFRYIAHGAQQDHFNCGVWALEAVRHYQQIGGDVAFFSTQQIAEVDIKTQRRGYSERLYPPAT